MSKALPSVSENEQAMITMFQVRQARLSPTQTYFHFKYKNSAKIQLPHTS